MVEIYSAFRIPDPDHPFPEDRGSGPSGKLVDFTPRPLDPQDVTGHIIEELSTHLGTYGTGGPGFFGLRLGAQWLVIALWGAGEWLTARGRSVQDSFYDRENRPRPWIDDWAAREEADQLSEHLIGQRIVKVDVRKHSLTLIFENSFDLSIDEDPASRPVRGGDQTPRALENKDDLREAVFLSPTTELWI